MRLADIEWNDVTLVGETVRDAGFKSDEVNDIISIGKPIVGDAVAVARASKQELDSELKLLSSTHLFPYVRFALSIRPGDKHDVRFVALDVRLESPGSEAISWSMQPIRVDQEIKTRTESKLSSKLKLEIAEIGGDESAMDEYVIYQPTVEAFNLNRNDPGWELRAAEGRKLSGIQILHMVVRLPKESTASARVSLRADIFRRGFLWTYRARSSDQSEEICATRLP
jgi:hypothetical protein